MKYLSRPEELVLLTIWKMKEEPYGVNIRKYITRSERGGKSKRYYELTKEGLKQLQEIKKIYQAFWKDARFVCEVDMTPKDTMMEMGKNSKTILRRPTKE